MVIKKGSLVSNVNMVGRWRSRKRKGKKKKKFINHQKITQSPKTLQRKGHNPNIGRKSQIG